MNKQLTAMWVSARTHDCEAAKSCLQDVKRPTFIWKNPDQTIQVIQSILLRKSLEIICSSISSKLDKYLD